MVILLNTTDTFTGALTIDGDIRGFGIQLVLNGGDSYQHATGQTSEYVYINAESGLQVTSSPDNWATGWAGRQIAYINKADASSHLPGLLTVDDAITATGAVTGSNLSGTNTGDEVQATTTVQGIIEIATQTEVNTGTDTTRAITPSRLRSTLGITSSLSTTLTYSELIGNGSATSIVVTHSIGNQFVQAQVYEVAGMDKVECEIELTSSYNYNF